MADLKVLAEELVNLTVKEVNELAQILKDVYGIEPAAAAGAAAPAAEEKTNFDVVLADAGAAKLGVVKAVKEGLPKAEAEALKKALEEAGAKVELK